MVWLWVYFSTDIRAILHSQVRKTLRNRHWDFDVVVCLFSQPWTLSNSMPSRNMKTRKKHTNAELEEESLLWFGSGRVSID